MSARLAVTASLLGEPARAAMLLQLMGGRALPAGQLALAANISPQTASGHLAKLVDAKLINVQRQGRHRYYYLSRTEVADAIEALLTLTPDNRCSADVVAHVPAIGTLAHARTCYSHLAGWLGVQITDALQKNARLVPASERSFAVTDRGIAWFAEMGIVNLSPGEKSWKEAKQCPDWTERRPHLAGSLGVSLYKRFLTLRWIAVTPASRVVRVTVLGKEQFWRHLQISIR